MNTKSNQLAVVKINGKSVAFFTPPHDEPDFPWVCVQDLAEAFLPKDAAARMVKHSQNFGKSSRAVTTARSGDRIATIMCHAMAQGLCGAMDQWTGSMEEEGPIYRQYCSVAGQVLIDHWPLSLEDMRHAFQNPGGPFMSDEKATI